MHANDTLVSNQYKKLCSERGTHIFKKFYRNLFSHDHTFSKSYFNFCRPNRFINSILFLNIDQASLNASIILNYNQKNKAIFCLPRYALIEIQDFFGIKINFFLSSLSWNFYLLKFFFKQVYKVLVIIKNIFFSNSAFANEDAFFFDLPSTDFDSNQYNSTFFSKINNITQTKSKKIIYNSKLVNFNHEKFEVKNSPLPFSISNKDVMLTILVTRVLLRTLINTRNYASILCLDELFLFELCKRVKHVSFCGEYFQSQSFHFYRPLWTYATEKPKFFLIFYSSNTAEIKIKNKDSYLFNSSYSLIDYNNIILLKNDINTKKILNEIYGIENVNFHWFDFFFWGKIRALSNPKSNKFRIAIFNIEPRNRGNVACLGLNEKYRFNFSIQKKFLEDIIKVTKKYDVEILCKTKRNIKQIDERYKDFINSLEGLDKIIFLSDETSVHDIVSSSDLIISFPFTSSSIIEPSKSMYYDPMELLDSKDLSHQNVKLIQGKANLESEFKNQIIKQKII